MQFFLFLVLPKIVAILFGLIYIRKLTIPYYLLFAQAVLGLICEGYGYYLGDILHQNNVWIFYFYVIVECWLIGIAGYLLLDNKLLRKIFVLLLGICSAIWLYDLIVNGIKIMSNRFLVSYGIVIVLLYISALFQRAFTGGKLLKNPVLWNAIAFILYYGCTIPYFGLWNYLISNSITLADKLFNILLILNFIRYLLNALSIYLYGIQHKAKTGISTSNTFPRSDL